MTFTGKEDHSITLEEASKLTRNYRNKEGKDAIKAGFFGKEALQKILDQEGCVGIRIYYGQEDSGSSQIVLVGANHEENDLDDGIILDRILPCPPYCGKSNPLNS